MDKVMKSFICRGCVNPVTGTGCTSVDIGGDANVNFCLFQIAKAHASVTPNYVTHHTSK